LLLGGLASLRENGTAGGGRMTENEIAKHIVDAAFKIHTTLGPGLYESVYEIALAYEFKKRGLSFVRQQPIPVIYETIRLEKGFRADFIVEGKVIIELKSVEFISPLHRKQLLTYLRLADKRLGLLINFNVSLIKDGISRVVNNLPE
jgi:GxxExxY protein